MAKLTNSFIINTLCGEKTQKQYLGTLKSFETEDWVDRKFVRPLSFMCAKVFAKMDIHPNTVTIWSMIIGAGSAYFYAQPGYYYDGVHGLWMTIIAILLLMWAEVYDCTDGQLARMTGKKSRIGRILDGSAGFVWFIPIYLAFDYHFYFHHEIEFSFLGIPDTEQNTLIATAIVFVLSLISGFAGCGGQQRLADYFIQIHLFFQNGEKGSELDTAEAQQKRLDETPVEGNRVWRAFLKSYVDYTKKQEADTPQFQRLMARLKEKYGSASNMPDELREEIHQESKKIMWWNVLQTFNFRSAMMWLFCLLDIPEVNFVWEIIGMGLLWSYVRYRHEAMSKKFADKI